MSGAKLIHHDVAGAPVRMGKGVEGVKVIDETTDDAFVGHAGVVEHLEYSCVCGQAYPGDPMICVRFPCGTLEEFWLEELGLEPRRGD